MSTTILVYVQNVTDLIPPGLVIFTQTTINQTPLATFVFFGGLLALMLWYTQKQRRTRARVVAEKVQLQKDKDRLEKEKLELEAKLASSSSALQAILGLHSTMTVLFAEKAQEATEFLNKYLALGKDYAVLDKNNEELLHQKAVREKTTKTKSLSFGAVVKGIFAAVISYLGHR